MSAAEGQRPSNYSSCCCSWIFCLIYALSTSTTVLPPIFLNIFNLSTYLPTYRSIYLSINPSSSIIFCQSINRPHPFPKYQYIISADPGASIGPCSDWKAQNKQKEAGSDRCKKRLRPSVTRFGENPPLCNHLKILAIYLRLTWFWAKFSTHFDTICMILGTFSLLKRPIIENTIWSSGHTAPTALHRKYFK